VNSPAAPATPTYGVDDAQKIRTIAGALFAMKCPRSIPLDIFDADYATRQRLFNYLLEIADEIESAPGPVEIELVMPECSKYSLEDSRDVLYLLRTALV